MRLHLLFTVIFYDIEDFLILIIEFRNIKVRSSILSFEISCLFWIIMKNIHIKIDFIKCIF